MNSYKGKVRINGRLIAVIVEAQSAVDAYNLLKAQYGHDVVVGQPIAVAG